MKAKTSKESIMDIERDFAKELANKRLQAIERMVVRAIARRIVTQEGGAELLREIWS